MKKRITITIDPKILKGVEKSAKDQRRSVSQMIEILVDDALLKGLQDDQPQEKR